MVDPSRLSLAQGRRVEQSAEPPRQHGYYSVGAATIHIDFRVSSTVSHHFYGIMLLPSILGLMMLKTTGLHVFEWLLSPSMAKEADGAVTSEGLG